MKILKGQDGKTSGYLHNNIILLPGTFEVAGVVLGDCVFNRKSVVKGKIVTSVIYSSSGEIIASIKGDYSPKKFDPAETIQKAWEIMTAIKDHSCPWIKLTENWSKESIEKFLTR